MSQSKKLNIITISLFFIFLFFVSINPVFAVERRTTTLDLTEHETQDELATEGWSWNSDTKILKLKDANFETTNFDKSLILPVGDVTIEFEGNNTLKSAKGTVIDGSHSNLTLKGINNGVLNLEMTELNSSGNFGLSLSYPKNLTIVSGNINSNGGFYIDDTITIDGGNITIDTEYMTGENRTAGIYAINQVVINNGNIDIKASSNGILVTAVVDTPAEDGIIINGGNISVSSQGYRIPAIYSGLYNKKNIVINGGNFTLGGDLGIYANLGNIYVNHIDSLNADNVKNKDEVIKVSSNDASNEVVYGNADYSKVDEAINKAKKLNKNEYKDFSAVEDAIAAVVRGKNVLEQSEVDEMALAINKAIDELILNDDIVNPNTSDINLYLLLSLIVASLGGITYTIKRYS